MIIDAPTDRKIQSTMTGEKVAMAIHEAAMAHVMSVLIGLYTDPELAAIREYSTNAWDAHVEAGETRPIEVTLPTSLAPFLIIKDYGPGLSRDGIAEIYSQYGASTKRETNEQQGSLGFGCKSALAYCDQFTLVGVKDGIKTTVSVARDEEDSGSMTIVSQEETDDASGVEIMIPVKRFNAIERKARDFFRYWDRGTVLINGEEPTPVKEEALKISDTMYLVKNSADIIVMGNVAYPIELTSYGSNYGLVAYVPLSAGLVFTPNREHLKDIKRNNDFIQNLREEFEEQSVVAVQREIDKAPNPREAIRQMVSWTDALDVTSNNYVYKGETIPIGFAPGDDFDHRAIKVTERDNPILSRARMYNKIPPEWASNALWCYGYDPQSKFTAPMKRRLKKYAYDNNIDCRYFILAELKIDSVWIDDDKIVDWEAIKAVKLERAQPLRPMKANRIPGSYDIRLATGRQDGVPGDDLNAKEPIFYTTSQDDLSYPPQLHRLLREEYPNCTIVWLSSNRVAKFMRHFPKAKQDRIAGGELFKAWAAKLTAGDKRALAVRANSNLDLLQALKPNKVKDKKLMQGIKAAQKDVSGILRRQRIFYQAGFNLNGEISSYHEDYFEPYPLARDHRALQHKDHTYLYLNAVHAEKEKNGN